MVAGSLRKKFMGDRAFYAMVLGVAVPIMIQNGITNFVSMLDNIMVGQLGTDPMSGVAIVNQVMFVFNLCIFGATSGAGIFGAQFAGKKDYDGLRSAMQFKMLVCVLIGFAGLAVYRLGGERLVTLYLHDGSESASMEQTLQHGLEYMNVMLWGLFPFVLTQVYSSTLREKGETVMPMIAGIVAVLTNLGLNYVLIFGRLGFEPMGVRGAAWATVVSRCVEMVIVMLFTHLNADVHPYIQHFYTRWHVPRQLAARITVQGMPLMLNEALWSSGMAKLNQCYSTRGLDGIAAINISSTIFNMFGIVWMALGASVGILVGQRLGAGDMDGARDTDNKLIAFSVASSLVTGALLIAVAPLFPNIYNTTDTVRGIATWLIRINALYMPLDAFANASYFTLRSGGKSGITFVFDSGFTWVVQIPVALALSHWTDLSIVPLCALCSCLVVLKCALGYVLVRRGNWLNNLTVEKAA